MKRAMEEDWGLAIQATRAIPELVYWWRIMSGTMGHALGNWEKR